MLATALRPAAATSMLGGLWLALSPLALGFAAEQPLLAVNDALVGWSLVAAEAARMRRQRRSAG